MNIDVINPNLYPDTGTEVDFAGTLNFGTADDGTAGKMLQDWFPAGTNIEQALNLGLGNAFKDVDTVMELGNGTITSVYLVPPWGLHDETNKLIMPEMLVFSEIPVSADDQSTVLFTLAKLNQIMHDAFEDFRAARIEGNSEYFKLAEEFNELLEDLGEEILEVYDRARSDEPGREHLMKQLKEAMGDKKFEKLTRFHHLAQTDVLCYQTMFGIMRRVNYLGVVVSTDRATSPEDTDDVDHRQNHCVVNVAVSRKAFVANHFGTSDRISSGSKLWLVLKRKKRALNGTVQYGEFCVVPYGGPEDYLRACDSYYVDPSGRSRRGFVWPVGTVQFGGKSNPSPTALVGASNLSSVPNLRSAFEDSGTLPTLTVTLGSKQ